MASGAAYIAECQAAGVPIPTTVLDASWTNHGIVTAPFISTGLNAELWSWTSTSPRGMCVALPRWSAPTGGTASLYGIICMSVVTSKTCYFDNNQSLPAYPRGALPMSQFLGGESLRTNGGGTCSDCHSGENPWIIHPQKTAFINFTTARAGFLSPDTWFDPLVTPLWPMNPGPIESLGVAPAGQSECTSCHEQGYAGRFPSPSLNLLSGWCGTVRAIALSQPTMPPSDAPGNYTAHRTELTRLCQSPSNGTIIQGSGPGDTTSLLGPPRIVEPLYTCGGKIGVVGMRFGAEVVLRRGGADIITKVARGELIEFALSELGALGMTGSWTAVQRVGAVTSPPSRAVTARAITTEFPTGLPVPRIFPALTHACAQSVAVSHIPGAKLEVRRIRTGMTNVRASDGSSLFRTAAPIDAPLTSQDSISARQQCGGAWTGWSTAVIPRAQPVPLPQPGVDNSEAFAGQQLVVVVGRTEGARTELGPLVSFSWPIDPEWVDIGAALGRPMATTDALPLRQRLCSASTPDFIVRPRACAELPAPEIETPLSGNNFVVMREYVPSSVIRVFAGPSATEIGDGSGGEIILTRSLVLGETLRVTQTLPGCVATQHFQVGVQ